jgi:hypothetical protein
MSSPGGFAEGVAQVNLLLNRASAWMDVDSYLPYEGKVVLKNKGARRAHIRLSTWIEKEKVRCLVNQKVIPTRWLKNYLLVEGLRGGDVVAILFPVKEKTEQLTEAAYGQTYTCNFKGNTLVDIAPRAERLSWRREPSDDGTVNPVNKGCPLYLRDEFKKNSAPMKKVERYISATLV